MSANVYIYIDPGEDEDTFNWEGPDTYHFERSRSTRLVGGRSKLGKRIFEDLTPAEQEALQTTGWMREERLELQDPKVLRKALLRFFGLCSRLFREGELEIDGLSRITILHEIQRDIGGALLVCERAIEQGKFVYWARW